MRRLLSTVSGAVALLALLAAVPLLWISTHVADEDGYVKLSSSVAEDSELRAAFTAYLSDELVSRGFVPAALEDTTRTVLTAVASRAANDAGFIDAWEETQRSFHRSAFADPTPRVLAVDLQPLASFVTKRVSGGLPITLRVPDGLVVPVISDAGDREAVQQVKDTTRYGTLAAVVALVGAASCLLLAHRRSAALTGLGIGSVVVAGLLWLVSGPAAQRVLDHTAAPSEFARTLQKLLVDRASDSLAAWLVVLAIVGGVVAVAGVVGRAVTGRAAA